MIIELIAPKMQIITKLLLSLKSWNGVKNQENYCYKPKTSKSYNNSLTILKK